MSTKKLIEVALSNGHGRGGSELRIYGVGQAGNTDRTDGKEEGFGVPESLTLLLTLIPTPIPHPRHLLHP
ncbi:MAG TPA: hypothetical protein VMW69_05900 [Spirochaetia bacterium]|nr:hypothetical protein [Spirochaetia bacterium]